MNAVPSQAPAVSGGRVGSQEKRSGKVGCTNMYLMDAGKRMMDAATSGKTWPAPTAVEVGQVRQVQVDVCGVTEGAVCVCVLYWMSPIAEERVRNEKCRAG